MNTRSAVIAWVLLVILSIMGLVVSGAEQDVQTINQAIKNLGASWIAGETSISRLSPEERAKRCGTFIEEIPDSARMPVPISKIVLPERFDWRDVDGNNWTTSIRNQGGCGSCWDFSVVGVFEMLLDYASGNPTDSPGEDLSEQYVLSCCDYCGSCGGGSPGSAFNFLQETGTVSEACLPYEADDSVPCENACGELPQRIGAWTYIYNDVESIKRAIYQYGPVSACFTVYEDFFHYISGVYEHVWGYGVGGHAISIVGWDDADQAWICKNSWGTDWGETIDGNPNTPGVGDGGWFRIKWGNCRINESVIMATLTSWPSGIIDVSVLDGLGHPVEYADVYVNGDWYGFTSHGGTVSLDLIEGMNYEITAFSSTGHFVLFDHVVAPGIVSLDCRDASYVTATANKLDGSPLDVGLYFQMGDWRLWCPEHTYGGTGWFYITPGFYDVQAWSWWDTTDSEKYNLSLQDVDLTSSTSISIDASALPTGRFALQTLLDFSALQLVTFAEGFSWGRGWWLVEGDSLVCSDGNYWTYTTLIREEGDWARWYYHGPDVQQTLADGQVIALEAGGDLSLFATPGQECYEPGGVARILTQMTDGFGNPIRWVERYDDTPLPPPPAPGSIYRLGPDGELEAFQSDGSPTPRMWDSFNPWMVVTSPSAAEIIDYETCLGCSEWIYLDIDAELGTYDIRVAQETHTGEIEGISSFEVALPDPDPYEPNDTCEAAYDLGNMPPAFTSDIAHFYDENEDWFTFNLTASGLLVIDTQLLGDYSDTMLYLYNTCNGELLAYNDDYGSLASHIEYRADPGTYYLLVDQCGQWYGGNMDYTFTIDLLPFPAIGIQGNDPIEISIPAESTQDFPGLIGVTNVGQVGSTLNYRILQQEIPVASSSMMEISSTKESLRELFPVDSLALRSFKGEPPTGDWDLLFIDADESPTGGVDLKELYAQIDNGTLFFKGVTYEPWADPYNLEVVIFLDADQDLSTGYNTEVSGMNMNDIGAEYALVLPYGYLLEFSNDWWQEAGQLDYLSMPHDASEFVVGVALSDLLPKALSETGGIDILFLLQDFSAEYPDYAPDAGQGHVTYPPNVSWLMQTPDGGTVTQGGMENITLTVDATGLVPGTTRHVRLFFLSNDGSVVPTRDIEIIVEPPACQELSNNLQPAGWHMIALPGELCSPCTLGTQCGDLICVLHDDLYPCYIFHYDPELSGYMMVPPTENICYHTGMGFWTRTYEDNVLIDAEVTMFSDPVEIPLADGWNQIGNPFNFEVSLDDVTVRYGGNEVSLEQAQANGWVSAYLFGYDMSSGGYVMTSPPGGCLEAWHGYWLRTYRDDCMLIISPEECSTLMTTARISSMAELRARGVELPPPPPIDPMSLGTEEVLAGLTVRNVPNPIRSEHTTTFKVQGAGAEQVEAIVLRIYDLGGALVYEQEVASTELDWHTDNSAGELLANGTYLYQILVRIGDVWHPTDVQKVVVLR